ncbi:MAG: phosphatidylglycerophosphatase A [Rhodospirillales bacterium]|nr:phosphatidylglycerophosphatase A [Rhodospirillales bacterium]MCB9965025.1 phosphatidylglycerophosphatase A [Rhodospirillales bacterium]
MLTSLNNAFATWFYLGKIPKAPGTWGSLGGLAFIYLLSFDWYYFFGHYITLTHFVCFTIFITIVGAYSAAKYDRDHGTHDSKKIVIDEVAGMMITCLPMVWLSTKYNAPLAFGSLLQPAIAFALFRFFDILKPWPISWIDRRVTGGWGVMLDDVVAGIFAAIVFTLIGLAVHAFI